MNYDTRRQNILIAENDRTVSELIQIRLHVAGYHTTIVRSGPALFDMLKQIRPSVLVLDLDLPGMSGFEVLETITPRGGRAPFPVLVMARKLAPEDIQRLVGLGARDCVVKPFSGAEIVERVARLLRRPGPPGQPARKVVYV